MTEGSVELGRLPGDEAYLVLGCEHPDFRSRNVETYKETFAYFERLSLPQADVDKILHHNAQQLFCFNH